MKLRGKRILVLGGTSGIGLAVAEAAMTEGSDVVVVSSQQRRIDAALKSLGKGAEGYVADLSDEITDEALFGKMGPFDHLGFTAGDSVWERALGEIKLDDAKSFFDVRFWGAFLVTKHGSKLIRPGGSIVLTSSTFPRRPALGFAIGASISSAGEAFSLSRAAHLAPLPLNFYGPTLI